MTLRRLLHSLAADESARAEVISDPGAVLARAGFDAIDDDLLGTALVHHADTAPVDELDALVPLLERFAPVDGVVREIDTAPDTPYEPSGEVDPTSGIDEFAARAEADPTRSIDEDALQVVDDAGSTSSWPDALGDTAADAFGTGAVPIIQPDGAAPPAGAPSTHDSPSSDGPDDLVDEPRIHEPPTDIEPALGAARDDRVDLDDPGADADEGIDLDLDLDLGG